MPRIYLAGPDVFRPDATSHFALLRAACERSALEALSPFDESENAKTSPHAIYVANMNLLRSASGVVANLAPFRGTEPDSGTVFEVGAAVALGLPVVAYGVPASSYADQVQAVLPVQPDGEGVLRDVAGLEVENFGLPLNLMLSRSVTFASSAEEAIKAMAALLGSQA